ncbi:hypothetical protein D3C79_934750 [compost metagenome]
MRRREARAEDRRHIAVKQLQDTVADSGRAGKQPIVVKASRDIAVVTAGSLVLQLRFINDMQ